MSKPTRILLADVSVLVAAGWPNHQFHRIAVDSLARPSRWATCALTELGFVRISSNPAINPSLVIKPATAEKAFGEMKRSRRHVFLDTMPSISAPEFADMWTHLLGHNQVSDAYLLRLARHHGATLLTLDRRLRALAGESATVEVLGPPPDH
ncbi:MAG: PIN domain-containing protein [Acidobacteria bacterium]|nr:PIN domain-containing protein [Acidobacteriota bacterium]